MNDAFENISHPVSVPPNTITKRRRVGRGQGSGNGCTAGRGTKGQKSRSGANIRPGFEGGQMPLYRRLPRRGFSNHPFKEMPQELSLGFINEKFSDGETVSIEALMKKKIVRKNTTFVKILGNGEVSKALIIDSTVMASLSVREKIIAKGGSFLQNLADANEESN